MTRKDFKLIAETIQAQLSSVEHLRSIGALTNNRAAEQHNSLVLFAHRMARNLKATNPAFKVSVFLSACDLPE